MHTVVRHYQLNVDCCKWLDNYINTLINQHIQSPLISNLFQINVMCVVQERDQWNRINFKLPGVTPI